MKKLLWNLLNLIKGFLPKNMMYIGGPDVLAAPLSKEEERKTIILLKEGNMRAKSTLIEHNLRLVVYISKKFDNTGIPLEDLISIGTIGLIKAVNTFKPEKEIKLATYASRCIENEILMHLRKVSRKRSEISLDEPLNMDGDGNELLLADVLGTDVDMVFHKMEGEVEKQMLYLAMLNLNERERDIVMMRYGIGETKEKTQKEVANMLGISQSYISRLEKKIITRLKVEMSKMA